MDALFMVSSNLQDIFYIKYGSPKKKAKAISGSVTLSEDTMS